MKILKLLKNVYKVVHKEKGSIYHTLLKLEK